MKRIEEGNGVTYRDPGHFQATVAPLPSLPPSIQETDVKPRDELLRSVQLKRFETNDQLWAAGKISTNERYAGLEGNLKERIIGTWKRVLFILEARDVRTGLQNYDLSLLNNRKVLERVNFSLKKIEDFSSTITLTDDTLRRHGLYDSSALSKLKTTSHWLRSDPIHATFKDENGKVTTLQGLVPSGADMHNPNIAMTRRIDDASGKTISYTGRADTRQKALQLIQFMVESEMHKDAARGLKETDEGFELTFLVNNLMAANGASRTGITFLNEWDERESILNEQEVFEALSGQTISITVEGIEHQVKIKPLYFNQGFNVLSSLPAPSLQNKINKKGYKQLFKLIDAAPQTPLLRSVKKHLQNRSKLRPEEELFYRDLATKLLNIAAVNHCRISTDRTAIALGIAQTLQSWMKLPESPYLKLPENPHDILSHAFFKELFLANMAACHQITGISRSSEGTVKGRKQKPKTLGFSWKNNPIAARMLPERYVKTTKLGRKTFNKMAKKSLLLH